MMVQGVQGGRTDAVDELHPLSMIAVYSASCREAQML